MKFDGKQKKKEKCCHQFPTISELNCRNFVCIMFMSPSGLVACTSFRLRQKLLSSILTVESNRTPKFMSLVPKKPYTNL